MKKTQRFWKHNSWIMILLLGLLLGLAGCQEEAAITPEEVQATVDTAVALTVSAQEANAAVEVAQATAVPTEAPPTATATLPPAPTMPPPPTSTPVPTATDTPVAEPTLEPTATEEPTELPPTAVPPTSAPVNTQPPPQPTAPPAPSGNLLVNGSFEDGWYNLNGAPEFQLPNGWTLEFDSGPTGFGSQAWDVWFPPEIRVLPYFQLPDSERGLFIRDGEYTIKAFKGNGPISLRFLQDIALQPGTYVFTAYVFPDLVSSYDGGKQYAADPFAGEVRFIAPGGGTGWLTFGAGFGKWGEFQHTFSIDTAQTVRIGVGMRGRYALASNGFFIDEWSLQRIGN
ncbi:MAG: hypothetical protein H6657_17910 [Ardenticatenaceae bacterium]|nr:hypothetical protein [Ardenticatenaceae bacterium]